MKRNEDGSWYQSDQMEEASKTQAQAKRSKPSNRFVRVSCLSTYVRTSYLESKNSHSTGNDGAHAQGIAVSSAGGDGRNDRGAARGSSDRGNDRGAARRSAAGDDRDGRRRDSRHGRHGGGLSGGRVSDAAGGGGDGDGDGGHGLRALGGGDGGDGSDGGFLGGRGSLRGRDDGGGGSGGGIRVGALAGVGDTELSRVLVLAGALDNEHQAVVGDVVLEVSAGGPGEAAVVGNLLGDGLDGLDVGAGAAEEDQRDGARGGGSPLNVEGLADGDLLVQAGLDDGIAPRGLGVVRGSVGADHGREGGDDGSKGETHYADVVLSKRI